MNEQRFEFKRAALAALVMALCLVPACSASAAAGDETRGPGMRSPEILIQQGFKPLFDGKSLAAWDVKPWHVGHWVAKDGIIDYDGKAKTKGGGDANLWTKDQFGDFVLYVEWRLPAKPEMKPLPLVLFNGDFLMQEDNPKQRVTRLHLDAGDSGILMRGVLKCQANIWSQELGSGEINGYRTDRKLPQEIRRACIPIRKADRPLGEWNAFEITLRGSRLTIVLNSEKVIDTPPLPDLPVAGPIALQHHGDPVQFRNVFIKPLP